MDSLTSHDLNTIKAEGLGGEERSYSVMNYTDRKRRNKYPNELTRDQTSVPGFNFFRRLMAIQVIFLRQDEQLLTPPWGS